MTRGAARSNGPDTITILVTTDNHVGYKERDPVRGDDSWKTFHEVMCLAKEHDVDMVLHAGDLFHENKPSRKSMYQVMRSLRMNCYGDKPCELEMLSDPTENFAGAFDHVNYEDPDINVAIPVFSIHGNHDDPSGDGHLAALDLLQTAGLVNYYGRTLESDNIEIKPVLLQKGKTKLALYGMSNVRDERMFRTFRAGGVKFFRPSTQQDNWFNLMSVHQNHHAYTETGYLPENFLPEFLDLVVWGHEHECLIQPRLNPDMGFHVIQPGSSVATSLMPGEAVAKHVAVLRITGKTFETEVVRLKTVRSFVMKEIVLQDIEQMKKIAKKDNNRPDITRYLVSVVESLIKEAKASWIELQQEASEVDESQMPLPLIRLRVEYTAPEGGRFDCENPQRFSNRFTGKVANVNDVIQFHRKKSSVLKKGKNDIEMPDESVLAQMEIDNVQVARLVKEFLSRQSLTILPQNTFGDAVTQFVDKDDRHAIEYFVGSSLTKQIDYLLSLENPDEEGLVKGMDQNRSVLENTFATGQLNNSSMAGVRSKPAHRDSETHNESHCQSGDVELVSNTAKGTIGGRAKAKNGITTTKTNTKRSTETARKLRIPDETNATAVKRATRADDNSRKTVRRSKKIMSEEQEDESDDDIVMLDQISDEEDSQEFEELEVLPKSNRTASRPSKQAPMTRSKVEMTRSTTTKHKPQPQTQSKLDFSQTPSSIRKGPPAPRAAAPLEISDDEINDESDGFEPL